MIGIGGDCFVLFLLVGMDEILVFNVFGVVLVGVDVVDLKVCGLYKVFLNMFDVVMMLMVIVGFCEMLECWGNFGFDMIFVFVIYYVEEGVLVVLCVVFDWVVV